MKTTKDLRAFLSELERKSSRVNGWYAHNQYDSYHPGRASVRGPFGRWLLVEGGENKPGELGVGIADLYDDAKFAAAIMSNARALLDDLDTLETRCAWQAERLEIAERLLGYMADGHCNNSDAEIWLEKYKKGPPK